MAYSGMASSLGIGLAIHLDDHFTRTANSVQGAMGQLGVSAQQLQKNLNDLNDFGVGLENIGRGILGFAQRGIESFARYDDIMNSVRVIAQIPKDRAKQELRELNTLNMGLAKEFGILPDAVANAQLELAKAGKKGQEIKNMTRSIMAMGAATDTQVDGVNGAAEVLVNIMQAFGAQSTEADRYAAVITSAANQSTIDVRDFFQSMRYAGDVAKSMNVPIEEAAAVIATLGNAGLKGSVAGTSYANMIRYLSTALSDFRTQKQDKAFDMLNLSITDFIDKKGELKSMAEILTVFRKSLSGLSQQDAFQASQAIFGVRGARGGSPLLTNLVEAMEGQYSYEDNLMKIIADRDNNVHVQQAVDRLDDLQGDIDRFKIAYDGMLKALGESLAPGVRNFLGKATRAINKATDLMGHPFMQKVFAVITSGGVLAVIAGKVIQGVARFGLFLLNFTNNFSQMMATYSVVTKSHNSNLKLSGQAMITAAKQMLLAAEKNLLAAKGITMVQGKGGGTFLSGRNAKGQFQKRVPANWLTRSLATIFGMKGARWGVQLMGWFSKLTTKMPWIMTLFTWVGRLGGVFGLLFKIVGKVFGALFGWPALIADIVLSFATGKGLFEWLWEVIKITADIFLGLNTASGALADSIKWVVNLVKAPFKSAWGAITGDFDAVEKAWSPVMDPLWRLISGNEGANDPSVARERALFEQMTQPNIPTKQQPEPLLFQDGQLIPRTTLKPQEQLSPKKVAGGGTTKVVEKRPINLDLTINTPEGTTKRRITLNDDDRAILGAAIV